MLHELWVSQTSQTFCLAGPNGDVARALLESDARWVWTVSADCAFEAMSKYYEYMGWGLYRSACPEVDMQPYSERSDLI
ncbi:hypothetical protein RQP53_15240 [Paucibacter sp. APW11]|uniref:Uncharacterized protein n=1 Tax=Roseateles aquae TaxID=3077235 RepID=A0ABU3PEU8_9BURK|nr:hypothetical protein [Paucibacter sp. APW11]MDT9000628.1 hypothetical protein [Paucibacter sp. APW11]